MISTNRNGISSLGLKRGTDRCFRMSVLSFSKFRFLVTVLNVLFTWLLKSKLAAKFKSSAWSTQFFSEHKQRCAIFERTNYYAQFIKTNGPFVIPNKLQFLHHVLIALYQVDPKTKWLERSTAVLKAQKYLWSENRLFGRSSVCYWLRYTHTFLA